MKKLLFVICIFATLLSSCWIFDDEESGPTEFGTKAFWAVDTSKDTYYRLYAKLLAENEYCKVYAETGKGISETVAYNVAAEYLVIRQKMLDAFGFIYSDGGRDYDTIQIADEFCDRDGKLTILLLDIKDDYKAGVNESYVAGYFYAGDFLNDYYSNKCDMIYIDTDPALKKNPADAYSTLAHELQHLMNFTATLMYRSEETDGVITDIFLMDTWINEGLSSAAEWVYSGEHLQDRVSWYNSQNGFGLIDRGNNFFVWDNHDDDMYAVLDDYATVYLFFQWLRLQSNDGKEIYKDIIVSEDSDYLAVTNAAADYIDQSDYGSGKWEKLLGDWLAANYINDTVGRYGYNNDTPLNSLTKHHFPVTGVNVKASLYPGEGVYSIANTPPTTSPSPPNIKYFYLADDTVDSSYTQPGTLLTFNGSTNIEGGAEQGAVTGVAANVSIAAPSQGRSVMPAGLTGPFRIGAGDVRRGGFGNFPSAGVLRLPNGLTLRE
jgi:hypothetical protein